MTLTIISIIGLLVWAVVSFFFFTDYREKAFNNKYTASDGFTRSIFIWAVIIVLLIKMEMSWLLIFPVWLISSLLFVPLREKDWKNNYYSKTSAVKYTIEGMFFLTGFPWTLLLDINLQERDKELKAKKEMERLEKEREERYRREAELSRQRQRELELGQPKEISLQQLVENWKSVDGRVNPVVYAGQASTPSELHERFKSGLITGSRKCPTCYHMSVTDVSGAISFNRYSDGNKLFSITSINSLCLHCGYYTTIDELQD